jgi:hypothetical protein
VSCCSPRARRATSRPPPTIRSALLSAQSASGPRDVGRPALGFRGSPARSAESGTARPALAKTRYSRPHRTRRWTADDGAGCAAGDKRVSRGRGRDTSDLRMQVPASRQRRRVQHARVCGEAGQRGCWPDYDQRRRVRSESRLAPRGASAGPGHVGHRVPPRRLVKRANRCSTAYSGRHPVAGAWRTREMWWSGASATKCDTMV